MAPPLEYVSVRFPANDVDAIARAGGELLEGARIPAELAAMVDNVLAEAG